MAYDVIGNVVDQDNKPISGAIVHDGTTGVATNSDGYYEIKTDKKILNFGMIGFKNETFDLSKYKDGSAVNVDMTLKFGDEKLENVLEIVDKKIPIKPPVKTPTSPLKVGLGVGFGAGLIAFLIAKYKLKSVPLIAGITIGTFVISGALAYTFQNKKNNKS